MSDDEKPESRAAVTEPRLERLAAARWPLAAAVAALLLFWFKGAIGPWGTVLAIVFVLFAAAFAPGRRQFESLARPNEGEDVVSQEALALLSGLPEPVLILDRRGTVLAFNAEAREWLGGIRNGDPISFVLRTPEVLDAVRAAATGASATVLYSERTPVERWREAHVATARANPDAALHIVVRLRDLTEQRRSERMRADFVANASHELRTPLASLLGFIETLQGPAKNDTVAREKFLGIMRTQANRMARLIDDLLSLSRIELKAHVRPDALVDLAALAGGVADALAPLAAERGVEIVVSAPEPLFVRGDRDELIRVAENLVENGIKYGQSGKKVDVTVKSGGGREGALFVVRDYGPGVAPEHLPRLTERFYRVDVADSRDKGGTGLGLALVKHILQRHGGRLLIDSAAGDGATFTVALPAASVNEQPAAEGYKKAG
ncbi:ATP-binding protein [Hansschlegelia quercus]|uniref:histidine kinase n=1 Tax=Hansschlegelia quercus TaxID=2528245 RepID=A0A4Q9GIK1_9HYPH|nr:ATP-binding protein [Hansschlegelia quercus]TBN53922.1 histidine kinase [Hansschlegelia quercus]